MSKPSGADAVTANQRLHNAVVEGIVRVIKHLAMVGAKTPVTMSDLYRVGTSHLTVDDQNAEGLGASTFILEFIKDGIVGLEQKSIDQVLSGDYSLIWKSTNEYLKRFGYQPVTPIALSVDS